MRPNPETTPGVGLTQAGSIDRPCRRINHSASEIAQLPVSA
jgi:hypothetical protein